jgi:hypothetical protein
MISRRTIMTRRHLVRIACAAAVLLGCDCAQAQIFRAYLSSTGSDANACTVVAPCRLLPAALAAVADGGEIWMLNSANYNTGPVTVAKSVSILAIPGALGSLVSTGGGAALLVDAPAVKVSLRNVVVRRLDGDGNGILMQQGARLEVNGCEIVGIADIGIDANAPGSTVTVRKTTIRDGAGIGFRANQGVSSLDEVDLAGNQFGLIAGDAQVTVANSVITGNQFGVFVAVFPGGLAALAIEDSMLSGNVFGAFVSSGVGSANALMVSRSMFTGHTGAGIAVSQDGSGIAQATLDNNIFTGNAAAITMNGGTVYTRGDNTLLFNNAGVTGGSLTALPGA